MIIIKVILFSITTDENLQSFSEEVENEVEKEGEKEVEEGGNKCYIEEEEEDLNRCGQTFNLLLGQKAAQELFLRLNCLSSGKRKVGGTRRGKKGYF